MTDEHGTARMEHVPGRAVRVTVLGPGLPALFLLLNQDIDAAATDWLTMTASPSIPGNIELRAGTSANLSLR
jgi:hypothetical protein